MSDPKSATNLLFLREEKLRQGIELLFYAYRDLTADTDAVLAEHGLGRAHHRALYFVGRYPQITIGALLDILRITKQSLGRVLNDLSRRGFVVQQPGQRDRRQRLLSLTESGRALERQISESQRQRLARAYRRAGAEAVEGFRTVLVGLIDDPPAELAQAERRT